ncbi:MAG: hypothetical protein AVDCRST_MAG93-7417, partial [uncultured Chloroflexia bacterium]
MTKTTDGASSSLAPIPADDPRRKLV